MDYKVKIYAKLKALEIPVELMESPDSPGDPYMFTNIGGETALVPTTMDELQNFYNTYLGEYYNDITFVIICSVCSKVLPMQIDFTNEELLTIPMPGELGAGVK